MLQSASFMLLIGDSNFSKSFSNVSSLFLLLFIFEYSAKILRELYFYAQKQLLL